MKNYNYTKIMVETYEHSPFMSCNRKEANDFYVNEVLKAGKNVLEYGTATGLLTIPLARAGVLVDSVDISPDMHEYVIERINNEDDLVKENINLILADMIEYKTDKKYDSIIIADNVLLAAGSLEKQIKFLKNARTHLKKGGKLILDIFTPDLDIIANGKDSQSCNFKIEKINRMYHAQIFTLVNPLKQILSIDFFHEVIEDDMTIKDKHYSHVDFRYLYPSELSLLLSLCGFKIESIYENFDYKPKCEYKTMQVVIATV